MDLMLLTWIGLHSVTGLETKIPKNIFYQTKKNYSNFLFTNTIYRLAKKSPTVYGIMQRVLCLANPSGDLHRAFVDKHCAA